ncbi:MAG TPA: hypothetical protein VKU62_03705 [Thermoanaerobaculia bacterium]|nr:hypothetical protein [Thermoanaerobaculia bacterium]
MVLLVVGIVQTLSAAVQYEFRQTTHSDLESMPPTDVTGRGIIDGDRSRVEFLSGTGFEIGTYIISTNGLHTMTFVNPMKKTYVDINAASVATTIGSARITITNKKINLTQLEDHPVVAGLPTDHYRLTLAYDITLAFGTIPLVQHVNEVIDKWVTQALGDIAETFLANGGIHTGNPDLDDLIGIENTKIKGFALKQTMSVTTTNDQQPQQTKLTMRRSITQTRELTLTSVEPKASIPSDLFMVPANFHRPDPLRDDTQKAPMQILTLQPSGGK